jgi:hypothetical protein
VELQLTFGGKPCADAGVVSVQVDVEGKVLAPNQFACTAGTTPSTTIALGQFAPGNYSVTVIGFDELGNIPYRVTQAMEVRSGSTKAFLVAAPPPGTLSLRWELLCFRQSMTVRATVDDHLFVDAQKNPDLPCDDRNRATIGPVASGSRRLTLVARNKFTPCFEAAQCFDFIANLDVTVAAGQDTVVDVTDWTQTRLNSASAHLRWSFEPGGLTCASTVADTVLVYMDAINTPQSEVPVGTSVGSTRCIGPDGAAVSEATIMQVPDGQHTFSIVGSSAPGGGEQFIHYCTRTPVPAMFSGPSTTEVVVTAQSGTCHSF